MRWGVAAAILTIAAPLQAQTAVTGIVYSQFVYQLADTANHTNGFDVTRAYVNVVSKFTGGIATRVTADIYRQIGDNSLRYRLKYAYVAYTPGTSPLTFKLGATQTPWLDWEEALWDYRMQGTVALDRNGYLSSSDIGFGIDGKWSGDRVNGAVIFMNGENYNGGTGDQRKDIAARISVRLRPTNDSSRVGGLRLTGYGHYGKPTGGGVRDRAIGMLSYRARELTLAAEYAITRDSSTATPVALLKGSVLSVYGVYHVAKSNMALIGRVDAVDPNTSAAGDRLTRVIGVYHVAKSNVALIGRVDAVDPN